MRRELATEKLNFGRCVQVENQIEGWEHYELTRIAATVLLRLADMSDMTIRAAGEHLILQLEDSWAEVGGDINSPPLAGAGNV